MTLGSVELADGTRAPASSASPTPCGTPRTSRSTAAGGATCPAEQRPAPLNPGSAGTLTRAQGRRPTRAFPETPTASRPSEDTGQLSPSRRHPPVRVLAGRRPTLVPPKTSAGSRLPEDTRPYASLRRHRRTLVPPKTSAGSRLPGDTRRYASLRGVGRLSSFPEESPRLPEDVASVPLSSFPDAALSPFRGRRPALAFPGTQAGCSVFLGGASTPLPSGGGQGCCLSGARGTARPATTHPHPPNKPPHPHRANPHPTDEYATTPLSSPSTALRALFPTLDPAGAAAESCPSTSITCLHHRTKSPAGISASRSTSSRPLPGGPHVRGPGEAEVGLPLPHALALA